MKFKYLMKLLITHVDCYDYYFNYVKKFVILNNNTKWEETNRLKNNCKKIKLNMLD